MAATLAEYDSLGRVKKQSVPTEVDSSWDPAGDDLTRGFLWTHQKYDWMGRVVRKINTDGIDQTTLNASDVLISYEGCGCAGGLVTTIEGELVPRTDTTGNARRKQKLYQDILGRTFKTETFEWDGSTVTPNQTDHTKKVPREKARNFSSLRRRMSTCDVEKEEREAHTRSRLLTSILLQ